MRINNSTIKSDGNYLSLAQNATQNPSNLTWKANDPTKDAYLIEMVDSNSNQGYITIKRSPATSKTISWSEIIRINHDGTIILRPSFVSSPSTPSSGEAKLYLSDYFDRLVTRLKTATDTSNILQGVGTTRIWVQKDASFPAGARQWDICIRPA